MKRFFTYLLIVVASQIFAQVNLVPNPSFEEKEYCPNGDVYKAAGWFSPTGTTPDIYRDSGNTGACYENCDWVGVVGYGNMGSYQLPRTGVAFAGMVTLLPSPTSSREYISIELTDTLQTGKKYCVSFYTCLSSYSALAYDKVGVCFSVTSPLDCAPNQIISNNGVTNPAGNVLLDTLNWTLVADTFVATGGELFLTLGNFQNYSDLQVDSTGFLAPWQCSQLFDDISVIYCDSVIVPPPTPPVYYDFTLFPNPSNGKFNITGNFPGGSEFVVYNMLGQIVCNGIALPEGNNEAPIFLDVAIGVYYYRVQSFGESLIDGMIEIVK